MTHEFPGTGAALAEDRLGKQVLLLGLALALLAGWVAWACLAPIGVQVHSRRARIEVEALVHPVHVDVAGRVRASRLELGRRVVRGEVLLELDRQGPELELRRAEARLRANREVLRRMESLVQAEHALVEQLEVAGRVAVDETSSRAERAAIVARISAEDARVSELLREEGAVAEMDAARSRAAAASEQALAEAESLASRRVEADQRSVLEERRVAIADLRVRMAELQGTIATDEVTVRRLRAELDKRTVRAPADGHLGWIDTMPSDLRVTEGQHVATVVPDGRLRVVAWFPAADAVGRIRPGQRATLRLDAFPRTRYGALTGRVVRVGSEPHDGEVRVEADLDDPGPASPAIPRAHGLEGTLGVTVERATPIGLLLRSIGRFGTGPGAPQP